MKRGVSTGKKSDFAAEKRHRVSANLHRGGKKRGSDLFGFVGDQLSPGCLLRRVNDERFIGIERKAVFGLPLRLLSNSIDCNP